MKLIVLKFGGSSLNTQELRKQAVKTIKCRIKDGYQPVIVVSAMGRSGEAYATDTLLNLLPDTSIDIHKSFITCCGENISAAILAEELNTNNIPARAVTGWQAGIITDNKAVNASITAVYTDNINNLLQQNITPVVCGFQGIDEQGNITTLGRGGSDTTAAVLCRSLGAEFLELHKDVAGIYTADPKIVKQARLIKKLDYKEIAELTYSGAKIIHNPAIRQLADLQIPLYLSSSHDGKVGTCIQPRRQQSAVTAVTSRSNLILVSICLSKKQYLTDIFKPLAARNISLDFVNVFMQKAAFVINCTDKDETIKVLKAKGFTYSLTENRCKITITGAGMTGQPGVIATLSFSLEKNNIAIDMITDSYSTISCLTSENDRDRALNIIHDHFNLQEV